VHASPSALAAHPAVRDAVRRAVEVANGQLARAERIKRFAIVPGPWEAGGEELTPTFKLRRSRIALKYAAEIDALYTSGSGRFSPGQEPVR
jgi:long-chain acyl-CoA synthetase